MQRLPTWLRAILTTCVGLALLPGGKAWAASFEVSPVRVALTAATPSSLITVRNQGSEPLRFQVTAFTWAQSPTGEMQLTPTDEIVVFPTMFAIKPGDHRNLRIGSTAPFGAAESTYRIFVEELPPLQSQAPSNTIRVLTRWGIPVFLSPPAPTPTPKIDGLSLQQGELAFTLRNAGNTFFMARHVRVSGLALDGSTMFTQELPAWYVLAGGLRAYTDALPDQGCTAARLQVSVETEVTTVQTSITLPKSACSN